MESFFLETMRILHLTELTQYIPNPEIWLWSAAALLGLACCFFGYSLRNLWFAGVCICVGFLCGAWLYQHEILNISFSVVAALVISALFVFTYRLASAELAFALTFGLATLKFGLSPLTALIPSILLVAAVLFLARWVITIMTAATGALAFLDAAAALGAALKLQPDFVKSILNMINAHGRGFYITLGVLALLGFLRQARIYTAHSLFRRG